MIKLIVKNTYRTMAVAALLCLPLPTKSSVLNIDFKGVRNVPGPDEPGPTYKGAGPTGAGDTWNGLKADSRLADGSDDDNLTVKGVNLLEDTGRVTVASFTVGPVGGDVCCAPAVTDETDGLALLNDYIFNNSAGNSAGESPFTIEGLGGNTTADIYFYIRSGAVTIPGATGSPLAEENGIFTPANTTVFTNVPVTAGKITGTMGGGVAVLWGMTVVTPQPVPAASNPTVKSVSPTGSAVRSNAQIAIELEDSDTLVATNTITLRVNDVPVTPSLSKAAGSKITTVSYIPAIALPERTNRVMLVFGNNSSPSVLQTNEFSFFVINDGDASFVINADLNGLRPDDTEGPTYSGPGAAGGGDIFNGLKADSTGGDDNITVTGENLRNSIGDPTTVSFSISPVGGDNNGAGTDPRASAALFGDYVFVASAGQTSGTSTFTFDGLGAVPAADLYFYYGITAAIEIAGAQSTPFVSSAPFTSGNTIYFKSAPVVGGKITGTFGKGAVALLHGFSIRKPAAGPFVKSTFPSGSGVLDDTVVRLELLDYVTQVQTNTIRLLVNGNQVNSTVTRSGNTNLTVVEFQGAGLPESTNRVQLIFADNAATPVSRTNEFSFSVVSRAKAKTVINIDFNGVRNVPGPDAVGPTYSGESAAGGGQVWNGILADSRLDDGTDEDNLTVAGTALLNSIGETTPVTFTVTPMGGDVGGAPTTNPSAQAALFSDYIFNNSAGNNAGESPFTIGGLGSAPYVDLYFYRGGGTITVNGVTASPVTPSGIFTSGNTTYFRNVPVTGGTAEGKFGPGTTVINGISVVLPLPRPLVRSTAPTGGGVAGDAPIIIELQDYIGEVKRDSIQLFLNDLAVTPVIDKPTGSAVTTVRFQPTQKLVGGSTNRVLLVFSDTSSTPTIQTNAFSFVVLDEVQAAKIVNIDFDGVRNVPGPDVPGSTYFGQSAAGGGFVWNGIAADSRLDDGTDNDELNLSGTNLVNSLGAPSGISFEVQNVGGDNGGGAPPATNSPAALTSDYFFNNSAANTAGESPFKISGLGDATTADLYFYKGPGNVKIPGASSSSFPASGIFGANNTLFFKDVPVANGVVSGVFGTGVTVIHGLTIRIPVAGQPPSSLSIAHASNALQVSWSGAGTLQSASTVRGAWENVANPTNPYTVNTTDTARFYRLKL